MSNQLNQQRKDVKEYITKMKTGLDHCRRYAGS